MIGRTLRFVRKSEPKSMLPVTGIAQKASPFTGRMESARCGKPLTGVVERRSTVSAGGSGNALGPGAAVPL
jgi:hypothetical protein